MTAHDTLDKNTQAGGHTKPGLRRNSYSKIITHTAFAILRSQMDAQAPATRRQVFLKYRELFTGKNVRKRKAIRKILLKNLPDSKASAGDTHINNVVSILKSLLEDGVFQSEEMASKHFPDLITGQSSEIPTGNISKKRKVSPRRSIGVGRVMETKTIDKSSPGTTAGMYFNYSLVR